MFTPPLNGALVCNPIDFNSVCAVFCKTGTDFVHNPPLLYYCSSGEWSIWPHGNSPPWPDCSGKNHRTYRMHYWRFSTCSLNKLVVDRQPAICYRWLNVIDNWLCAMKRFTHWRIYSQTRSARTWWLTLTTHAQITIRMPKPLSTDFNCSYNIL